MTALVFFLVFAFLAAGAAGTIPIYRDSGDLIVSAATLGIAHPPGYPAYVLSAKLFQWLLPWGNLAYRTNVLSAFYGAAALALLYKALRGYSKVAALSAMALFALSPAFVALGRVSEMYTLALLVAVAIFYGIQKQTKSSHRLAAFLLGVGMGVHPTLIFLAPLFVRGIGKNEKPWREVILWSAFFLLGCSIILFLPLRAHTQPLQNWGDPSSWRQFWRVLTRADYGGFKLHPVESTWNWTPESIFAQLQFFTQDLAGEWGWGALLLACAGVAVSLRQKGWRHGGAYLAFILMGPAFFVLSNLPLSEATTPAILQPYLLIPSLFIAGALAFMLSLLKERHIGALAGGLVIMVLALPHAGWTFGARHDFLAYDFGRNLFRALPPHAVLYDPDDPTSFTLRALQITEKRRRDVILLNFFHTRWGYEQLRQRTDLLPDYPIANAQELEQTLWTYSRQRHPFYAELPQKFENKPYVSEGLVYAAYPQEIAASRARAEANLALMSRRDFSQTTDYNDFFARHLVNYYAAAHCNLGLDYAHDRDYARAVFHYKAALAIDPELAVAYNNWGTLAYLQKDYPQAIALYKAGLAVHPGDAGLQSNLDLAVAKTPRSP